MKKKILIVDDDFSLNNSIVNYLIDEGFQVLSTNDVQSAIHQMKQNKPDMIITDIMMPELSGYDFIKMLRSNQNFVKIPVIFLTAKGMTQDRIKGYDLGCSAYLTKPFDPNELLSIIHNVFRNIYTTQKDSTNIRKLFKSKYDKLLMDKLTNRERTILSLVIQGYRNKEIAQYLHISIRNVEKYVSRLLNKTSTRNRTELAQLVTYMDIDNNNLEGE